MITGQPCRPFTLSLTRNSLHTNSRDEAFGTPTEDTVRDVVVQLILSKVWLASEREPITGIILRRMVDR